MRPYKRVLRDEDRSSLATYGMMSGVELRETLTNRIHAWVCCACAFKITTVQRRISLPITSVDTAIMGSEANMINANNQLVRNIATLPPIRVATLERREAPAVVNASNWFVSCDIDDQRKARKSPLPLCRLLTVFRRLISSPAPLRSKKVASFDKKAAINFMRTLAAIRFPAKPKHSVVRACNKIEPMFAYTTKRR